MLGRNLSAITLGNADSAKGFTSHAHAAVSTTTTRVDPLGNTVITTVSTPRGPWAEERQCTVGNGANIHTNANEIKYATFLFKAIDIDGNGFLSRAEVHLALKRYGFSEHKIDQLFRSADGNGDNVLSFGTSYPFVCSQWHDPSISGAAYNVMA